MGWRWAGRGGGGGVGWGRKGLLQTEWPRRFLCYGWWLPNGSLECPGLPPSNHIWRSYSRKGTVTCRLLRMMTPETGSWECFSSIYNFVYFCRPCLPTHCDWKICRGPGEGTESIPGLLHHRQVRHHRLLLRATSSPGRVWVASSDPLAPNISYHCTQLLAFYEEWPAAFS
jgi:hypothetical protein